MKNRPNSPIDQDLEQFAYPGELDRLEVLAREFNDPCANEDSDGPFILGWAIDALSFGIEQVLGRKHPLFLEARKVAKSCVTSEALLVWRQVGELPKDVLQEMIEGVRDQRNHWAADHGEGFDLR